MNPNKIIAVMGATASGKTALSIAIAKYYQTEIISVDSRQMYKGLDIGTAKPSREELLSVPHHFIDCLPLSEEINAGGFAKMARNKIDELCTKHQVIVLCGGSTLYYKALLEGMDSIPPIDDEIRIKAQNYFNTEGIEKLQVLIQTIDSIYYSNTDVQNPRRLIRALEVFWQTGKPLSSFQMGGKANVLPYPVYKFSIELSRDILYNRIEKRCDIMLENGLLEEVKTVHPFKELQALKTVGYQEFFEFLEGKVSYSEAVLLFKQHSRNYAKRQLTWLRKDSEISWLKESSLKAIIDRVGE